MFKGKLKSLLLAGISAAVAAAIAVAGTMAVLTTKGSNPINVFTSGDIKISVTEDVDIITKGQGGGEFSINENGAAYTNVMPGDYLKEEVKVKNTGSNKAYVRVAVIMNNADLLNDAVDTIFENQPYNYTEEQIQKIYDSIFDGFGFNYTKPLVDGKADGVRLTITDKKPEHVLNVDTTQNIYDYARISRENWFKSDVEKAQGWAPGFGTGYYSDSLLSYERCWVYYIELDPTESTTLFNGINIPVDFDADQMKFFENLNIEVYADAIQAASFNGDAKAAFAALEEIHPWASERAIVSDEAALKTAIENGATTVVLKNDIALTAPIELKSNINIIGNGYTLTAPTSSRIVNIQEKMDANITISDITLDATGSERGISFFSNKGALNVIIVDSKIKSDYYTVNVSSKNEKATLTVKDSELEGYCAYQSWSENVEATFVNCSLTGINSHYNNPQYPYSNDYATIVINEGANNNKLTFTGCKIIASEAEALAARNAEKWPATQYHIRDNAEGTEVIWNNCEFIKNGEDIGYPIEAGKSYVEDADALIEALENGEDVVLLDDVKINPAAMTNAYGKTGINVKNGQSINGNGNTLDIKGAGGTWDSGINTTGGEIKDLTVTGSFRGIFISHNSDYSEPVILNNVTIDGTVYTISCDQGKNQNLIAKNSTFKGWTSYAATLGTASFTDCYFGEGSGYSYMRPYAPTTLTNCTFEEGFEFDATRTEVVFENCYVGDTLITADNITELLGSSAANATVK